MFSNRPTIASPEDMRAAVRCPIEQHHTARDVDYTYQSEQAAGSGLRATEADQTIFDSLCDRIEQITRRAHVNLDAIDQIGIHAGQIGDRLGVAPSEKDPAPAKVAGERTVDVALPTGALPRLAHMLDMLELAVCGQSSPIGYASGEVRRLAILA